MCHVHSNRFIRLRATVALSEKPCASVLPFASIARGAAVHHSALGSYWHNKSITTIAAYDILYLHKIHTKPWVNIYILQRAITETSHSVKQRRRRKVPHQQRVLFDQRRHVSPLVFSCSLYSIPRYIYYFLLPLFRCDCFIYSLYFVCYLSIRVCVCVRAFACRFNTVGFGNWLM